LMWSPVVVKAYPVRVHAASMLQSLESMPVDALFFQCPVTRSTIPFRCWRWGVMNSGFRLQPQATGVKLWLVKTKPLSDPGRNGVGTHPDVTNRVSMLAPAPSRAFSLYPSKTCVSPVIPGYDSRSPKPARSNCRALPIPRIIG
jgi:hypothetical protein